MKVNSEKKESRELIPGKVLEKWIQASKAELFYEALLDEINMFAASNSKNVLKKYTSSSSWTNYIISRKNGKSAIEKALISTYKSIFQESNHTYYGPRLDREYYRIDNILSITNAGKKDEETGINIHNWKLLAAVEHENDYKDWTDELVKLLFVNAPLRVVIGYAEYDESIYYSKAIHVANKITEMQNFRTHLDAEDEYILIMGPREKDLEADVKNLADCFKMYKWSSVTNKFELYKK